VAAIISPICVGTEKVSEECEEECEAVGDDEVFGVVGIDVYWGLDGDGLVDWWAGVINCQRGKFD
jgi:hypothetical protein